MQGFSDGSIKLGLQAVPLICVMGLAGQCGNLCSGGKLPSSWWFAPGQRSQSHATLN